MLLFWCCFQLAGEAIDSPTDNKQVKNNKNGKNGKNGKKNGKNGKKNGKKTTSKNKKTANKSGNKSGNKYHDPPTTDEAPAKKQKVETAAEKAARETETSKRMDAHEQGMPFLMNPTLKLREYQKEGVNWLVSMCSRKLNGILADEMVRVLQVFVERSFERSLECVVCQNTLSPTL